MTPVTTPPASGMLVPPTWRNRLVLLPLLCAFALAVYVFTQEWRPQNRVRVFSDITPTLQALLFRQGTRLDLYDVSSPKTIRTATPFEDAQEIARPARLLSPKAVLIASEQHARVRDMASAYAYDPLAGSGSPLVLLSRNTNFTFSLSDESRNPRVRIAFSGCGDIADIPLSAAADWYEPAPLFEALGVPQQRRMVLSPAETTLAVIDHAALPRISVVHLTQRTAMTLAVPSFDPEQVHFSPFFVNDQILLFSVLDRSHWGTVLYRLSDGTYEMLSPTFTDAAYHSATGKAILMQSFFDNDRNIPFGSTVLLGQERSIPVADLEEIIGPRDSQTALLILGLLFQDLEATSLQFKRDLTIRSFNVIENSQMREALRSLWDEHRLKLSNAVGTFQILRLEPDNTLTKLDTVSFTVQPPATVATFTQNIEPLLRSLEVSDTFIQEYRKRNEDTMKRGEEYLLVDELSF
ncbi:MAG TPA: hypothetical protein DDX11_01585 [Candidatus Peribacter riflensis]|nr:hypothetical protein [Candidatus Peribacter riflensis]